MGVDGCENELRNDNDDAADDDDLLFCEAKPEPDEHADKRRFSSALLLNNLAFTSLFFREDVR